MQYLDSDDANTQYMDARNPDRTLNVSFYTKAVQNNFQSEIQKRPIFDDVIMVRIICPGDDKNIIDTVARDDHKERFPQQWMRFKNKQSPEDQMMAGKTPLSMWAFLKPSQVEELRALKFYAVDDIANASDSQIDSVGMIGGMSPMAFRDRARMFLRAAAGEAGDTTQAVKMKELENQNATLVAQMEAMNQRLAALAAASAAVDVASEDAPRRGRPPKQPE